MDRENYVKENRKQTKLTHDPIVVVTQKVTDTLLDLNKEDIIDDNTHDYLIPDSATTSRFYLLIKLHKEGHPGRPIVSCSNCPTEKISEFVDRHLRPLATGVSSYTRHHIFPQENSYGWIPST